jgi:hypothetical protein
MSPKVVALGFDLNQPQNLGRHSHALKKLVSPILAFNFLPTLPTDVLTSLAYSPIDLRV